MKLPSDYTVYPHGSVMDQYAEMIAKNIMKILAKNGNEWRRLEWNEYSHEMCIDVDFCQDEIDYFEKVNDFCVSPNHAACFSEVWE